MKKLFTQETPVVFAPTRIYDPMDAIMTLKGYCEKHAKCSEVCRLFDKEERQCFFWDLDAGTPCDWKLPPREEDEK